jgi:hypothetical protein
MKKLLFVFFLLFCLQTINAQKIESVFINIPENYMPLLSKEKRSDLLARYNLAEIDTITNNFGGKSKLLVLDKENNFLKLSLTNKSFFELKIWTKSDSTQMFGFVHTVCGPVCDSNLGFFSLDFQRLDLKEGDIFPNFAVKDFFDAEKIKSEGLNIEDLVTKYDMLFATIEIMPEENDIFLISNSKEFLPKEIYSEIKPYLLGDKVRFIWKNGFFEKGEIVWK